MRAFIAAVRATDFGPLEHVLSPELTARYREDWAARVDALEQALDRPEALRLSSDARRAELQYGEDRVLSLEQTAAGWRITQLE